MRLKPDYRAPHRPDLCVTYRLPNPGDESRIVFTCDVPSHKESFVGCCGLDRAGGWEVPNCPYGSECSLNSPRYGRRA